MGRRWVRVEVDRETAPLLGLLTHRRIGGSLFCQLALSMLELDDTRRPSAYRERPEPSPIFRSGGFSRSIFNPNF